MNRSRRPSALRLPNCSAEYATSGRSGSKPGAWWKGYHETFKNPSSLSCAPWRVAGADAPDQAGCLGRAIVEQAHDPACLRQSKLNADEELSAFLDGLFE